MAINSSQPTFPTETWTLRRQFVVPLGLLIFGIAITISVLTAWVSSRVERAEIMQRLAKVYDQLARSHYPLTPAIVSQIENYSGVDIVLISSSGRPTTTSLSRAEVSAVLQHPEYIDAIAEEQSSKLFELKDAPFAQSRRVRCFSFRQSQRSASYQGVILLLSDPVRTRQISALTWAPAISGMISVLMMMLVSSWIASRLAGRIETLESHVKQLSVGAYDCIKLPGPRDAVYRLSQRINSLSQDLQVAHDVISKTERARLISLVASGMAHDIRNSLAGASLLLETYLRGCEDVNAAEVKMALEELKKVSASVRRLLASDPHTELLDEPDLALRQIEMTLRETAGRYADHQQVDFDVHGFDSDLLIPQGSAIANTLVNLCINAVEAATRGGKVEVELKIRRDEDASPYTYVLAPELNLEQGDQLVWRVWDDGNGPPEAISQSIMEPFVTSKPEGVGLGLAMAKRVAERNTGSLRWFREGERTCFELMIPWKTTNEVKPESQVQANTTR